MENIHKKRTVLVLSIFIVAFLIRLPGLGQFMTVDEENWTLRSAGFWHNIFRNHDTGGAFMTTHPGAPAMWIIGSGVVWQENRLGFDTDTSNLSHFRLAATLPIAVATALLVALSAYILSYLENIRVASLTGFLLAVSTYLTGMSQIAHLDALLALFMLNALLSFFVALKSGKISWLIFGGILTGLALATKLLPALWLLMFFSLVLFTRLFFSPKIRWQKAVRILGFLSGIASLTFYAVWPALWFTDDIGRSFAKDVPTVVADAHVAIEESTEATEPSTFYFRTFLGRTTPFVMTLSAASLSILVIQSIKRKTWRPALWYFVYALGFLLMISLAAKKGDRYALPALIVFVAIAGWGLDKTVQTIQLLFKNLPKFGIVLSTAMLAVLLVAETIVWMPYAIAYNNPWFDVRPFSQQGWGEGLDAAAEWLNNHPFAGNLTVASWYPSVMRTYFKGKTMSLSSRDDHRVGFVVTYRNMDGRAPDDIASDVLDEFVNLKPEKIIYIQDKPYVWIYNILGPHYFRQHVGEITAGVEVGQVIPIAENNWDHIEFGLATFSGRNNTQDLIMQIKDTPDSQQVIREVRINAAEVQDEAWQNFKFDPISNTEPRSYYVSLTSPTSYAGNALTVRFVKEDVMPGQMFLRRQSPNNTHKQSEFLRDGDLAYRL